jgi:uncharacterized RDD family membrane protein YckC
MPENLFCSKCGAQNLNAPQFCQKCGASMWPAGTAVQPAQAAAPAIAPQPAYVQPLAYAPAQPSPYGGFWIRLLAYFIDHIVLSVVAAPLALILVMPNMARIIHEAERSGNGEPSPELIISIITSFSLYLCLALIGQWLYEALLTSSSWQGTIGKKLLRLKVTDEAGNRIGFGRATGRFFAKWLSSLMLYIGFFMIGFTDRKRGLHDMLAGTLVMKY